MYCEGMHVVAKRYVNDTVLAEDMVQDAFIKAFQNLIQFKGDVTFGAWLKKIVINRCFDEMKMRQLEIVDTDVYKVNTIEEDSWLVSDETTIEEVKLIIEGLPQNYKSVVKLYLMEGYDHKEISEILKVTESTSRSILSRGKKRIQEQIKHLDYGTKS